LFVSTKCQTQQAQQREEGGIIRSTGVPISP